MTSGATLYDSCKWHSVLGPTVRVGGSLRWATDDPEADGSDSEPEIGEPTTEDEETGNQGAKMANRRPGITLPRVSRGCSLGTAQRSVTA